MEEILFGLLRKIYLTRSKSLYIKENAIFRKQDIILAVTHLLPPNTILMSSRAPIGLLSIAKTELCTNQGFKSFRSQSGKHINLPVLLSKHSHQADRTTRHWNNIQRGVS